MNAKEYKKDLLANLSDKELKTTKLTFKRPEPLSDKEIADLLFPFRHPNSKLIFPKK
ncbi:MAG: hypothetical protein ACQEUT_16165 [Bacillota bacterium]